LCLTDTADSIALSALLQQACTTGSNICGDS